MSHTGGLNLFEKRKLSCPYRDSSCPLRGFCYGTPDFCSQGQNKSSVEEKAQVCYFLFGFETLYCQLLAK